MKKKRDRLSSDAQFWQSAFLAVLPVAMKVQGWRMDNGRPITQGRDRIALAANWADAAFEMREKRITRSTDESE